MRFKNAGTKAVAALAGGALLLAPFALRPSGAETPPQDPSAAPKPDLAPSAEVYVVHGGDTLWDVSGKFFRDPFYWPKLWEENDYITNPHVLMPGDKLDLRPGAGARRRAADRAGHRAALGLGDAGATVGGAGRDGGEAVKAGGRTYYFPEARHTGFIGVEGLERMGMVVGADIDRNYYEPDDLVYVTFPSDQAVNVGDKMAAYVQGREVFEPGTTDKIGTFLRLSGVLEITQFVEEGAYKAKVLLAYGEIHRQNRVRPFVPRVADIVVRDSPAEVEGRIVVFDNELQRAGQNSIVYLNVGLEDGVEVGNKLTVYREGARVYDPVGERKVKYPEVLTGRLVVISADAGTSGALVVESPSNISVGDLVRVAK